MTQRDVEFEWSIAKAASNLREHGVSFDEAETAFDDSLAWIFDDEWNSDDERREILIGHSNQNRVLFVSFVQRAHDRIRIISARPADAGERRTYAETSRF